MTRPNFKDALSRWIESPDPRLERVVDYHEGRLEAGELDAFEAQLEDDDEARALLDELRAFEAAADDVTDDPASEFEVAATMRAVRRREAARSSRASTSRSGTSRSGGPIGSWAAAAALAVLSFGLGWLSSGTGGTSPGLAPAQIHHLAADSELRSGDGATIELRATAARQVLVVTPVETLETGREVGCAVFEVGADAPVIGPVSLQVGEHGIVILSFEKSLAAGDYELRLTDADGAEPIESLPFRWDPVSP